MVLWRRLLLCFFSHKFWLKLLIFRGKLLVSGRVGPFFFPNKMADTFRSNNYQPLKKMNSHISISPSASPQGYPSIFLVREHHSATHFRVNFWARAVVNWESSTTSFSKTLGEEIFFPAGKKGDAWASVMELFEDWRQQDVIIFSPSRWCVFFLQLHMDPRLIR